MRCHAWGSQETLGESDGDGVIDHLDIRVGLQRIGQWWDQEEGMMKSWDHEATPNYPCHCRDEMLTVLRVERPVVEGPQSDQGK